MTHEMIPSLQMIVTQQRYPRKFLVFIYTKFKFIKKMADNKPQIIAYDILKTLSILNNIVKNRN
jgi:hypothetical protein